MNETAKEKTYSAHFQRTSSKQEEIFTTLEGSFPGFPYISSSAVLFGAMLTEVSVAAERMFEHELIYGNPGKLPSRVVTKIQKNLN